MASGTGGSSWMPWSPSNSETVAGTTVGALLQRDARKRSAGDGLVEQDLYRRIDGHVCEAARRTDLLLRPGRLCRFRFRCRRTP